MIIRWQTHRSIRDTAAAQLNDQSLSVEYWRPEELSEVRRTIVDEVGKRRFKFNALKLPCRLEMFSVDKWFMVRLMKCFYSLASTTIGSVSLGTKMRSIVSSIVTQHRECIGIMHADQHCLNVDKLKNSSALSWSHVATPRSNYALVNCSLQSDISILNIVQNCRLFFVDVPGWKKNSQPLIANSASNRLCSPCTVLFPPYTSSWKQLYKPFRFCSDIRKRNKNPCKPPNYTLCTCLIKFCQ